MVRIDVKIALHDVGTKDFKYNIQFVDSFFRKCTNLIDVGVIGNEKSTKEDLEH